MQMKRIIIVVVLASITIAAKPQKITSMYMENLPIAGYTKASFFPKYKFSIGITPVSSFQFMYNSSIKFSDIISEVDNGVARINVTEFLTGMRPTNYFNVQLDYELLSTSFKVKNNFFSLALTNKTFTEIRIPRDLILLAWKGNGSFLGSRASFDNMGVDMFNYNELAIGYTRNIRDALHVGGRVKILQGISCFNTEKSVFGLTTDTSTYWLNMDYAFRMNIAAPLDIDTDGFKMDEFIVNDLLGFENIGFGFDVGADIMVSKKFNLGLSVVDLGYLQWNGMVKNLSVEDGHLTFQGIEIDTSLNFNFSDSALQVLQDTLLDKFKPVRTTDPFITPLNTRLYLNGTYLINDKHRVGAICQSRMGGKLNDMSLSLLYRYSPARFFDFTASYTMNSIGYSKVGTGISLSLLGSSFYFVTDDLLSFFLPQNAKSLSFNFGWYYVQRKLDKTKKVKNMPKQKTPDQPKPQPDIKDKPKGELNKGN